MLKCVINQLWGQMSLLFNLCFFRPNDNQNPQTSYENKYSEFKKYHFISYKENTETQIQ